MKENKHHLVIDNYPVAYPKRHDRNAQQVAGFLEERYGLQKVFRKGFKKQIAKELLSFYSKKQKSGVKAREYLVPEIAKLYKKALTDAWFNGKVNGTPTKASIKRAMAGKRNKPSFVDSGTFKNSIRAKLIKT